MNCDRLVVYHRGCPDGLASAAVMHYHITLTEKPDYKVYYVAARPDEDQMVHLIEQIKTLFPKNVDLWFLDLTFTDKLYQLVKSWFTDYIIVDHHPSTGKLPNDNDDCIYSATECGASLTWYALFLSDLPLYLRYVRDRDLFLFKEPDSRAVNAGLRKVTPYRTVPVDESKMTPIPYVWDPFWVANYTDKTNEKSEEKDEEKSEEKDEAKTEEKDDDKTEDKTKQEEKRKPQAQAQALDFRKIFTLLKSDDWLEETLKIGKIYLEVQNENINMLARLATLVNIDEHKVRIINCPIYISDLSEHVYKNDKEADYVLVWRYDHRTNRCHVSLRSADDKTDVNVVAKRYGGGGHAHASAFKCDMEKLKTLLKM